MSDQQHKDLIEYFETGCACIHTYNVLEKYKGSDLKEGARYYLENCKCSRNLVDGNNHKIEDYI